MKGEGEAILRLRSALAEGSSYTVVHQAVQSWLEGLFTTEELAERVNIDIPDAKKARRSEK